MPISSLKMEHWPEADRLMWDRLIRGGRLLDDAGPGAGWAPETKRVYARDYGYWLSYLLGAEDTALVETPIERPNPARVRGYCQSMERLAPITMSGRIARLYIMLHLAHPDLDLNWLAEMARLLERAARRLGPVRSKQGRILHSGRLYQAGLELLMAAHGSTSDGPRARSIDFRDGLMIALLAARPLRLKNFTALRVGCQIREVSSGYLIDIPGHETKTGQPIEFRVPEDLSPWIRAYIEIYRPLLMCDRGSDFLWLHNLGGPYSPGSLSQRVAKLTKRLVGVSVSPHLFRDCAATTIAIDDPEHVMIIAAILGHSSLTTAENHYNHARCLEASRRYQHSIRNLRRQAHFPIGRRRCPQDC